MVHAVSCSSLNTVSAGHLLQTRRKERLSDLINAHLQWLAEDCGGSRYQHGILLHQLLLGGCQHVQHTLSPQPAVKNLSGSAALEVGGITKNPKP